MKTLIPMYVAAPGFANDPAHVRTRYWMRVNIEETESAYGDEARAEFSRGYVEARLDFLTFGERDEARLYWEDMRKRYRKGLPMFE